jgi:hypothetical protein
MKNDKLDRFNQKLNLNDELDRFNRFNQILNLNNEGRFYTLLNEEIEIILDDILSASVIYSNKKILNTKDLYGGIYTVNIQENGIGKLANKFSLNKIYRIIDKNSDEITLDNNEKFKLSRDIDNFDKGDWIIMENNTIELFDKNFEENKIYHVTGIVSKGEEWNSSYLAQIDNDPYKQKYIRPSLYKLLQNNDYKIKLSNIKSLSIDEKDIIIKSKEYLLVMGKNIGEDPFGHPIYNITLEGNIDKPVKKFIYDNVIVNKTKIMYDPSDPYKSISPLDLKNN